MALILSLLVAVSSFLTAPSSNPDPIQDTKRLETLVFALPLNEFVALARQQSESDKWFDWSTDYCSAPFVGNSGRTFDFTESCVRHDFAYRNYKLLDLRYSCLHRRSQQICASDSARFTRYWNSKTRLRIDQNFRNDMLRHCSSRFILDYVPCKAWASVFYRAVRVAGGI